MDFAQIAGWVNQHFMPTTRFVKTSRGAQDSGNAVRLDADGKLDNSLLHTGTGNGLDADTVDGAHYETGTWTPQLQFGGANVGMTGTMTGSYTRIGRLVFITCAIILSAKGSSTGNATITGLPFTSIATYASYLTVRMFNATLTGDVIPVIGIGASSNTINEMTVIDSGTSANMTNAHFNDNSRLLLSGCYQTI